MILSSRAQFGFQYPLADRLGFWGVFVALGLAVFLLFQYPLADRLGFWGVPDLHLADASLVFQYPLADRLGFWGLLVGVDATGNDSVSVSSCGSTWFLGKALTQVQLAQKLVSVSSCGSTWFLGQAFT